MFLERMGLSFPAQLWLQGLAPGLTFVETFQSINWGVLSEVTPDAVLGGLCQLCSGSCTELEIKHKTFRMQRKFSDPLGHLLGTNPLLGWFGGQTQLSSK